jgi:dTDP-4-dehydrorhamnose reductase
MKIFITGHRGFVGRELLKRGFLPLECNVTSPLEVEKAIKYAKPDLVVHLAAKTDIDWCEDRRNQDEVINVNVKGTFLLFRALAEAGIPAVYLSSDHIWRGGWFEKHGENSKNTPPVNYYGLSKVVAEQQVSTQGGKIIRTSYLFNSKRLQDKIRDAEIGMKQSYPTFITRSFLHVQDFCDTLEIYCQKFGKMPKVLNLSGSKTVSWFKFMREIETQYGFKHNSVKPRFFEKKGLVPRPHYGGLDTGLSQKLGFPKIDYIGGIERMKNEG